MYVCMFSVLIIYAVLAIYDFIINTVTVCKVYAGDNTAIQQLFNYLTCTVPSK